MHDINRHLRSWLESWGAWRRIRLNIDYPIESISCKPEIHIATPIVEPSFLMPVYDDRKQPHENAARLVAYERLLREYYHIKRTETKPQRVARSPDYDPHWRMNYIDRAILELPKQQRIAIRLRYECELKATEIAAQISRKPETVNKRISAAYKNLRYLPTMLINPENYYLLRQNDNNAATG